MPQSRGTLNWSFSLRMALMVVTGSVSPACCCTVFSLRKQEKRTGCRQTHSLPQEPGTSSCRKLPGLSKPSRYSQHSRMEAISSILPTQPRGPELQGSLKKPSKATPHMGPGSLTSLQDSKKSISHLWGQSLPLGYS